MNWHWSGNKKPMTDQTNPTNPLNSDDKSDKSTDTTAEMPNSMTLEEQLAAAQKQVAENLDGWQRARADFVNYRKRADKEREETYATATADAYLKLMPVIDDFDLAMSHLPADDGDQVTKSVRMIHRKFGTLLESAGMTILNPLGEMFDPAIHEALGQDSGSDKPAGTITAVLRKGYTFNGKVIRPPLVRVAG